MIVLVDFLANLPNVFRERYLNIHETYLYGIAYIIDKMYKPSNYRIMSTRMLLQLLSQEPKLSEKRQDSNQETLEFRNLRNSWYHECALNYPFNSLDERLKFASWKIIQCYYSVLSSVASLVCCYNKERKSVDAILNIYAREFPSKKERKAFVLPPFNLYLNQQGVIPNDAIELINLKYAKALGVPRITKCLQSAHKENSVTAIPHYLRTLRDWVTYQDAYLLFRLYGQSPKLTLDSALSKIAFAYCLQTEFYLINLFGWDAFKRQHKVFSTELKNNLEIESPTLSARFNALESLNL